MTARPRSSTLVLAGAFVLTLVLYLAVRPEPSPRTELVPAVRVPVTSTTDSPDATTTTPPDPTTTTTAEETTTTPPEITTSTTTDELPPPTTEDPASTADSNEGATP